MAKGWEGGGGGVKRESARVQTGERWSERARARAKQDLGICTCPKYKLTSYRMPLVYDVPFAVDNHKLMLNNLPDRAVASRATFGWGRAAHRPLPHANIISRLGDTECSSSLIFVALNGCSKLGHWNGLRRYYESS